MAIDNRIKSQHEIVVGSTTYRLNLMKDETGKSIYKVNHIIPDHQNPLIFAQNNWIGGHGQFDMKKVGLYHSGQSIDTTTDGRIILAPLLNNVQESDNTDLDSAVVDFAYLPANDEWICATSGNIYRWSPTATGTVSGACVQGTPVTLTPAAATTITTTGNGTITVTLAGGSGTTADVSGGVISGIPNVLKIGVNTLICSGAGSFSITLSNGKWKQASTTVDKVLQLCLFGAYLFAARGDSTTGDKYAYSVDGNTWVEAGTTDAYANGFIVVPNTAGTADILYKWNQTNQIKYNTDGTGSTTQWTVTPIYIGDASGSITGCMIQNNRFLIGKSNNLYYYDSDGAIHPQFPELNVNRSTNNFKYSTYWENSLYFSLGDGLGEITSYDSFARVGALTGIDDIGKYGTPVGLTADRDWLYVAMKEGSYYTIYKGRETAVDIDGDGADELVWQWCPFVYLGTNACGVIKVNQYSDGYRRLWFGYGNSTGCVDLYDNPTADSRARFCASGTLRMSYFYGTNPYWDKMFQSIVTETKSCAAGITVTPKYYKDTDTSSSALTAAITTNGITKTNLSTAITCNRISFEVVLASNDNTKTPELLYFQARGIEKPEVIRVHECVYAVESDPSQSSKTVRTALRTARTSTSLIKFADLRFGDSTGDTSYVWVIASEDSPEEIEVTETKGRMPELGIRMKWQEVSFTVS